MSNKFTFVDVHGFAGGLSLGVAQSGFELLGKKEGKGGFGAPNMEANRHLLGDKWQTQEGTYDEWEPIDADLVIGNPPCSGFSLLSSKSYRGVNSVANACMWGITEYAAKIAPPIFAFESVQGAYTAGAELMRDLRAHLEKLTGLKYDLTHVLHSARSMGNPQMRRRYMFVAHRVPFGVEVPLPRELPTVEQAIGDLEGLALQWEAQKNTSTPRSKWAKNLHKSKVDGHIGVDIPHTRRVRGLLETGLWEPGMDLAKVLHKMYDLDMEWPDLYARRQDHFVGNGFNFGFNTPLRVRPDHVCPVVTGGGLDLLVHYKENRTLTHREVARLMGYPDDWKIEPLRDYKALRLTWGKGVTVDVGRYFGTWLHNSLDGNPGEVRGELIGDRERLINVTQSWKAAL